MRLLAALCVLTVTAAFPGALRAGEPATDVRPWKRYEVLVERNVFSRDRGRAAKPASAQPAAVTPASYLILKGVAQDGDRFVAFLENLQGVTTKVTVGEKLAGAEIVAVSLDGLTYRQGAETRKIEIGERLGGSPPSGGVGPAPTGGAKRPSRPAASGSKAGGSEADILDRLRRRRMRELGK